MKNVTLIFFVLLATKNLYSQINVVAKPVFGDQYHFVYKNTGATSNEFLWEETEGFVNGYAKVAANHLWTLVDGNGQPISVKRYDAVRNFYNKLAVIKSNNKWGIIDEKGNSIIPCEYDIIFDFKETVTGAYKNNKWYLINRQAVIVKTLDIDVFYGFQNGIAKFIKQGRSGTMSLNGDIVSIEPLKNTVVTSIPFKPNSAARPQSAPCPPNIDFELGNFTNWNCFTGSVAASGTTNVITVTPSPPTATRHEIYTAPFGLDPYGLFSTTPPDGSGKALKVGNNINGAKAERVTYQMTIPAGSTDASITYRYAVVFEDPGHFSYQQPRFSAKLRDVATNTYLPCASYEYISDSTLPGFFNSPIDATVKCKNWASVFINLSAYAGRTLDLEFTTADCTRGAHWGYAYVDVGNCNISADISYQCSPSVATVSAPPGFQFYNWWNSNFTTILATGQNATISPIPPFNSVLHVEVIPFNGYGCKDTLDVLVTNSYSLADAGPDKFICEGTATTIGTSAIAGNTYSWSPSTFLSNANIANPSANPPISTTYYLTVTNAANACPKIDTVNIVVNPKPVPAFAQPANQCLAGNSFTFNNTSTGGATYFWTFGDGTNSTLQNPTHIYATAANYTVQLVVTTSNGCKDSMSRNFNVFPQPIASFTQPANQCLAGNSFTFNNTSSGAATYYWTFGDGTNSTQQNPTHNYTTAANYTVQLVVTTSNGCKDSISRSFNVFSKPIASFVQPINQCVTGNSFTFNNTSIGAATYYWTFGDGTNSTLQNPTHVYTTASNFTVQLVVTSSNGCKDSLSNSFNVYPKPVAAFTQPANQCLAGNSFTFNNTSTGASTYYWTFGDGTNSNQQNPTHIYATAANYTVQLVVTTSNGCKDSLNRSFTVFPKPIPSFTQPINQCLAGNSFTFNNTSTGAATYYWTFGDGTNSTQQNPTHVYTTAASFTVKLVVTSSNGCKDSLSRSFTVFPKPTASYAQPINQCLAGNSFTFNNTSTGAATYYWTFGDGTNSTQQTPTHVYTIAASFTVKLVVTSSNGCKDSISRSFNVYPKPTASFSQPANQCLAGNSFTFNNASTGAATYYWTFGDGTSSTVLNPTHVYATASNFTVKLVVTSSNGCKDSLSRSFTVFPKPTASFAQPVNQCLAGNSFTFNNTSTGAATYYWTFGDGATSTLLNPTHVYTTAANYTVQLVVTTSNGCKDSVSRSFNVFPRPIPSFTQPANQCLAGNSFTFNNTSTGAATYYWTFGDGTNSTQQNPTHTYTTAANYTVQLVLTTSNGCKDSLSRSLTVYSKPIATFTQPANQCLAGNSFTFNNTSTGAATYYWTFGDGTNSTLQNPTHTYATATNYTVQLVVTTSNGCKDSISRSFNIFPKPIPSFTQPANQCLAGNSFTFNNTSTGAANYYWTFGDGNTSTLLNPTHVYTTASNYIVQLVVTSSNGCKDSVSRSFNVFARPIPSFTQPANQCLAGNSFTFNNTSTGAATYYWTFGDGTNSTLQNPTHAYATALNFTVQLVVTSGNGCKDSVSRTFNVFPKPVPAFAQPANQCLAGNSFTFNNMSTGASTYYWTFGDGNTSTLQNPTHVYTMAGNYTIQLVAITSNGCKDSVSRSFDVFPKPVPDFTQPANQCLSGNSFTFNNTSTGAATYFWTFGDGTNSTQQNPTHVYTTVANYTVQLVVTTSNGCKDSLSRSINVFPKPIPAFTQPANQCISGNIFTFNNTSTGAATYYWTFGDGTNSTLQNPTHVYTTAANYTVQLVVTTSNGCKDSISRSLTVFPKPIPSFTQPVNQCLRNNVFVFANTSTGGASYFWNFGDSTTSTDFNPTHTYSNAGNFTVKLIVTNTNGCKDSTTRSFNVNQSPNITIQNNHAICLGDSVQLSTIGAQTYQWYPALGLSCSACPNPMATPTANTTYTLTGLTNLGCIANATINITVRQPIKILVSPNKAVCGKSSTNLFAVGANSYTWSPATGLNSTTIANPVASPDTTTTYMVIGYDANNCFKDTGYVKITVHPIPAIELGPDVTLSTGTIYPILPQTISGPIVSWAWTPAINLSCTNCPNPLATVKFDITYRALVKNIYGCTAIDTLRIHTLCKGSQVFVPNAFTPDGDGRNDMLVVRSSGINAIRSFKIYSRWGELLFEKYNFPPNNPTYGWDGKIKGRAGSAEVYVYILEVTCDNNEKLAFKGNISILN